MYARTRVSLSLACGVVAAGLSMLVPAIRAERELVVLIAWSGVCASFLLGVLINLYGMDSATTRKLAEREDNGRASSRAMLSIGSLVSLLAVGFALVRGHELAKSNSPLETVVVVATLLTVALTWLLVHVDAMLHYARLYYDGADGGIDFGDEPPDYMDFAYLAFTVGMTYQVSDTNITSRRIRRAILHHAMLSYMFGTILVALTINGVASLAG